MINITMDEEREKEGLLVNRGDCTVGPRGSRATIDGVLNFIGYGPFQVVAFFLAGILLLVQLGCRSVCLHRQAGAGKQIKNFI